jgi:DMSO/TMAO reductase YedYZ heme-binding membrane subunit
MTRLLTARAILGVLAATLMVVLLTLLSCITLSADPVKDRVITGCISCSAGLVTVVTIMCLLETSNSVSVTSSGSRPTKTESTDWTWRFSPPSETEKH